MERISTLIAGMLLAAVPPGTSAAAARQAGTAPPLPAGPPPAAAPIADPTTDMNIDMNTDTGLLLGTAQERMTVPVSIGNRGPWPFIIDTGAERTVVSRQLAALLGLAAGPALRVVAMTGPSAVASVIVPLLSVSTLVQPTITAPSLEARNIGAAGMLGIDALQGHSIDIDFDRSAMTVRPSSRHHVVAGADGDEIVVVARSLYGQLIVTDARWRGRRIAVVIDTGSSLTIGNPRLLAIMGARARPLGPATSISVTGMELHAQGYVVDDLSIGGIRFANVAVAIADAAPFRRFALENRPALMLGMDTLRLFRRVRIDFANRAVEFTLPRDDGRRFGRGPGA